MTRRKNYYFVGTGLQVINSVEYIYKMNLMQDENIVVLCNTKISVRKEVESVLHLYKWDRIIYLSPNIIFHIKPQILRFIIYNLLSIVKIKSFDIKNSNLIGNDISYFFRYAAKLANAQNITLIDDGSGSINYKLNSPYNELKSKKNRILYKLLGIDKFIVQPKVFFTTFYKEMKGRFDFEIIENKFSYLKQVNSVSKVSNKIYFIGDPHVERGYLTKEQYIERLIQIKEQFNEEIVYIPRIYEDAFKLAEISKIVKVQKNNIPFELFFVTSGVRPKALIGYHSSVLFNIHKLYGNTIDYYFIRLPNYTNEIHYNNIRKIWQKLDIFAKEIKLTDS